MLSGETDRPISLIGMSNSGKSHWTNKLREIGFQTIDCDDLIEEQLGKELTSLGFSGGIQDVSKWMGQPFEPQYPKASQRYLELEAEVLSEALRKIKDGTNLAIDTTGSVVCLPPEILAILAAETRVFYLETPEDKVQEMYERYIQEPKPVIWGKSFSKKDFETDMEALARCYPDLLAFRTSRYADLAHVTLKYEELRDPNFTVENFIQRIQQLS